MKRLFMLVSACCTAYAAPLHAQESRITSAGIQIDQKAETRKNADRLVRSTATGAQYRLQPTRVQPTKDLRLSDAARKRIDAVNKEPSLPAHAQIPSVLSDADIKLYKKMFRLQRQRQRSQVAALVPKLQSDVLMGHLIAERLLHPNTRTPYNDLRRWLDKYNDHAQAPDVYKLANARRPKSGGYWHKKPQTMRSSLAKYSNPDYLPAAKGGKNTKERRTLLNTLKYYRKKQYYTKAMNKLKTSRVYHLLGEQTWAQVSLRLAQHMMMDGYYSKSFKVAEGVMRKTKFRENEALWIAGFSGYKLKQYTTAAKRFRKLAYSVPQNSKYFAQSAYWAAKSYEASGGNSLSSVFLQLATQDATSFYGQLAAEKLALPTRRDWKVPLVKPSDKDFLFSDPIVKRVIALSEIGEYALAQQELKLMHARVPYDMDESLLALSIALKLPNTSMTLARNLRERGKVYISGLFPDVAWEPRGGYREDKALIHAIMRQESAFSPDVNSRVGARGLMQLMPDTARYIRQKQKKPIYSKHAMVIPSINLMLGQDYISYLNERVDGNLIHIIAAYNAGPGNVDKWEKRRIGNGDPVEFIESIPFSETRKYVKYVMANLWMYRDRYSYDTPELTAMANNRWPMKDERAAVLSSSSGR